VHNLALREFVEEALCNDQSSSAISGRLKYREKNLPYVSKNTIYDFLDGPYGRIIKKKKKKKKGLKRSKKVMTLQDRRFIEKRPQIVGKRARTGDCEGDFIVSGRNGKGNILVVVDRKIRITFLEKIDNVCIDNVHQAFLKIQKMFPEMKTLTLDNDILFQMHKTLENLLSVKIYFCRPYHSWEKGSVENVNKHIRKYIPKGSDLSQHDQEYISFIEQKCNERFMECLKYATPKEKLEEYYRRIKKQRTWRC